MAASPVEKRDGESSLITSVGTLVTNPVVFVALVSILVYAITLLYELGYCTYFSIPYYLVTISGTSNASWLHVLGSLALVLLAAGYTMLVSYLVFSPRERLRRRIFYGVLFSILAFVLGKVLGHSWIVASIAVPFAWYVALVAFAIAKEIRRGRASRQFGAGGGEWYQVTLRRFAAVFVVIAIALLLWLAYELGRGRAQTLTDFLVLAPQAKGAPELVVLYSDGEHFISTPFCRRSHETQRTFILLDRTSLAQEQRTLRLENTGQLHPAPER